MESKKILVVDKLNKYFNKSGKLVKVLDNVSFDVYENDFLGIIGESGSGKSTTGKCIIRLYSSSSGNIIFDDKIINQNKISKKDKNWLCRNMSMVFQDPMSSLNSRKNVLSIIAEPLIINKTLSSDTKALLKRCSIINQYFQNTYKWQDYNLTKEFVLPFYQNSIKNYQDAISKINTISSGLENLLEIKNEFIDLENNLKSEIKLITEYNRLIKLLITYNYEIYVNNELHETELDYKAKEIFLKNEKKLTQAPKEYWELKEQCDYLENKLNNFKSDIEFNFCQQSQNRYKSIIKRYSSEINTLKNNSILTNSITENISQKVEILILKDTLSAMNHLKDHTFMKDFEIEKLSNEVNTIIKNKYNTLLNEISVLNKISEELDKLSNENSSKETIKEKLTNYKKQYEIVVNLYDKLEKINFIDHDGNFKKLINDYINYSTTNKNQYHEDLKQKQKEIDDLKQKLEKLKNKKLSENKNYENAKKEFEISKNIRNNFIDQDNEFFNNNKLPLIKNQNELIKEYKKQIVKLQKELKKSIQSKIKLSKKEISNDKSKLTNLKIIEKEINLKFLTIEAINFEIENYEEDLKLYRRLRTKSKTKLYANYKSLKNSLMRTYVYNALDEVGLKNEHAYRYPHEFSGGQRQRIVIARALISKPKLVIADEPISALDVSIQAQVINIMKSLANRYGITFLFIAHDLSMVRYTSNRLIIMHRGKIVEKGNTSEVFNNPIHPYTKSLIKASPELSKIHIDLASFSSRMDYDKNYSPTNQPAFYKLENEKEHYVFATEDQFKKWTTK